MKLKSAPAQFKAAGASDSGEFEAIVSVFGNVDSWGDVVMPGAFVDTIADWKSSGNTLSVLWSHKMDDPEKNIGAVTEMAELAPGDPRIPDWVDDFVKAHGGLWVKGVIDTGPDASRVAVQGLRLMKSRRVTQFSYAYDEIESGPVTVDGRDAWGLLKLKIYEVSPTQIGANDLTALLGAKQRNTHASPAVRHAAAELLAALDAEPANGSDAAKSRDEPPAKRDNEPAQQSMATFRVLHDIALAECELLI